RRSGLTPPRRAGDPAFADRPTCRRARGARRLSRAGPAADSRQQHFATCRCCRGVTGRRQARLPLARRAYVRRAVCRARRRARLARELRLGADHLFLDFPSKPDMLEVAVPVVGRAGSATEHLGLPRVATELLRSAQRLRVFVLEPVEIPARAIVELVTWPRGEVEARLNADQGLLRVGA